MKYIWLYIVAIVASLGGLLSGYDTGVISGALLFINETWDLSDSLQGFLVSSVLIGAVIGAATNGILADIFGRKKIIMATAVIRFNYVCLRPKCISSDNFKNFRRLCRWYR